VIVSIFQSRILSPGAFFFQSQVRITRMFAALIVLVHAVITCHYYYSWPFDNLCKDPSVAFTATGLANAAFLNASTTDVYKQCNSVSDNFLPYPERQEWFQEPIEGGTFDAQYQLVLFYYVCAWVIVCYILVTYLGSDTYGSIYSLFYYKFEGGGETFDTRYNLPNACWMSVLIVRVEREMFSLRAHLFAGLDCVCHVKEVMLMSGLLSLYGVVSTRAFSRHTQNNSTQVRDGVVGRRLRAASFSGGRE
jgi:hypothetical protein